MHALTSPEHVVLVDSLNTPIGTLPKATVHGTYTPLHRGFSVFLFNAKGEVLLQQRSSHKQTWPLVWSGSCCGHPLPDESVEDAIHRRVSHELGLHTIVNLREMLPSFRYSCIRDNIMEHEICPVWVGVIQEPVATNPEEVEATEWKSWEYVRHTVENHPGTYSEWCELEVMALAELPLFREYRNAL